MRMRRFTYGVMLAVITVAAVSLGAQHPDNAMATEDKLEILQVIAEYSYTFDSLTADTARSRTMVIITVHDNTQSTQDVSIFLTGIYEDEWRRTPEGWRFARRTLKG